MMTGEISLIEALVWPVLIFLGILFTVGIGVYGLVYYWQGKTSQELDEVRAHLRTFQAKIGRLRAAARPFSADDPEPFGSLDIQLEAKLKVIEEDLRELHVNYGEVRSSTTALDMKDWKAIFQMPSHWYQVRQRVNDVLADSQRLAVLVEQSEVLVDKLERQGWEVALAARAQFEQARRAIEILTALRGENVHDRELDSALSEAEDWEEKLNNQVPVYFLSGDEAAVLSQADKHTIVDVFLVLQDAKPVVTRLLGNAQQWKETYNSLVEALEKLTQTFRDLANRFTELESSPLYPLEWNQSRTPLAQARQQIQAAAADNKRRTLEEITRDLGRAEAVTASLQKITQQAQTAAQQHEELKQILGTQDIQQGEEWCRNVKKLVTQVQEYHSDNWPRSDAVQALPEEVEALLEHQHNVPLAHSTEPVKETALPALLEDARGLAVLHHSIRPRVSGIQTRLNEIKETERNTRDAVARTRALLNQTESVTGSNELLAKAAGGEIRSLSKEIDAIFDELQQSAEGLIDKKAQRANNAIRKAEQLGNRLLDQINADLVNKKSDLRAKVEALAEVASLQDPSIEEARKLLAKEMETPESDQGRAGARGKSQLSFAEVVPDLKRKNEAWQRSISVVHALEDIEHPVLERYDHAAEIRDETAALLEKALDVIPETRSWPPTQQMVTSERRQFKGLEVEMDALRQEPVPVLQVVSRLSDLAERYQSLASKLHAMVEKAEQEQARIFELEARLEESKRLWEYHLNAYSDNLVIQDEIRDLLDQTDQEMNAIKLRYERGSSPYNQVAQNIRMLCQKLDAAVVTVDNRQIMDINGVVQKKV